MSRLLLGVCAKVACMWSSKRVGKNATSNHRYLPFFRPFLVLLDLVANTKKVVITSWRFWRSQSCEHKNLYTDTPIDTRILFTTRKCLWIKVLYLFTMWKCLWIIRDRDKENKDCSFFTQWTYCHHENFWRNWKFRLNNF